MHCLISSRRRRSLNASATCSGATSCTAGEVRPTRYAGDYAAAGKELGQCIVLGDQIGTLFHRGAFLAFVARVRLHEGDFAGAQRAIEEAVHIAVETRQPWGQSIALRVQSEIWLSSLPQQLDAAEAAVRTAIDVQVAREAAAILRGRAWCWAVYCRLKATAQRG